MNQSLDGRVARLEEKTDHIQSDVTDIKAHLRRLDDKFDKLVDTLAELRLEMKLGRWHDKVWWLLITGALLGVMARGFHWI